MNSNYNKFVNLFHKSLKNLTLLNFDLIFKLSQINIIFYRAFLDLILCQKINIFPLFLSQ